MEKRKTMTAAEAKKWMCYYFGRLCESTEIVKIGIHSDCMIVEVWDLLDKWAEEYASEQKEFKSVLSTERYLCGRLLGIGWKALNVPCTEPGEPLFSENQECEEKPDVSKMKKILFEEAERMIQDPNGPIVYLDFESTTIPAESEADLKRFADMCDFYIAEEQEEVKDFPKFDGMKKISYEEAIRIFDDPKGPELYLLHEDGNKGIVKSKDFLCTHGKLGGVFGIDFSAAFLKGIMQGFHSDMKKISFEEAKVMLHDPNLPDVYLLFENGDEYKAETVFELIIHDKHEGEFGIRKTA